MRSKRIVDNWLYSLGKLVTFNKKCWKYVLKRWWKSFVYILTFVATVVTILSLCKEINDNLFTVSFLLINLLCITIVSFMVSLPKNYLSYRIRGLNGTKIELIIGDMFREKCDMVIPTNTCFDVEGKSIKDQSVQGQFRNIFYNEEIKLLNENIENELKKLNCIKKRLENKVIGKKIQYPLNTIITLQSGQQADDQRFHWIAINHSGCEAEAIIDSVNLQKSIDALWKYLSIHRKIRDLCLPILGTGYAGVNQPLPEVVEYYIDSFIIQSKKSNIVKTLKIYLYPNSEDVFENHKYIANYLKYRSKNSLTIEKKYLDDHPLQSE